MKRSIKKSSREIYQSASLAVIILHKLDTCQEEEFFKILLKLNLDYITFWQEWHAVILLKLQISHLRIFLF
jgi:hypothetical protein